MAGFKGAGKNKPPVAQRQETRIGFYLARRRRSRRFRLGASGGRIALSKTRKESFSASPFLFLLFTRGSRKIQRFALAHCVAFRIDRKLKPIGLAGSAAASPESEEDEPTPRQKPRQSSNAHAPHGQGFLGREGRQTPGAALQARLRAAEGHRHFPQSECNPAAGENKKAGDAGPPLHRAPPRPADKRFVCHPNRRLLQTKIPWDCGNGVGGILAIGLQQGNFETF